MKDNPWKFFLTDILPMYVNSPYQTNGIEIEWNQNKKFQHFAMAQHHRLGENLSA
jgi:hypothetical protein